MELSFDIRGHLKPYERIEISYEDFKEFFVNSFEKDSTRHQIFENYEKYTQDFSKEVTGNFRQWINGSFVSNKTNPLDYSKRMRIEIEVKTGNIAPPH